MQGQPERTACANASIHLHTDCRKLVYATGDAPTHETTLCQKKGFKMQTLSHSFGICKNLSWPSLSLTWGHKSYIQIHKVAFHIYLHYTWFSAGSHMLHIVDCRWWDCHMIGVESSSCSSRLYYQAASCLHLRQYVFMYMSIFTLSCTYTKSNLLGVYLEVCTCTCSVICTIMPTMLSPIVLYACTTIRRNACHWSENAFH